VLSGELYNVILCRKCDPLLPIPFEDDAERERWTAAHLARFPDHVNDVVWREELIRQGKIRERLHRIHARTTIHEVGIFNDARRITVDFIAPLGGEIRVDTSTGEVFEVLVDVGYTNGDGTWSRPTDDHAARNGLVKPRHDEFDMDDTQPFFGMWAPPVMPKEIK
jgi:hypothetical protein